MRTALTSILCFLVCWSFPETTGASGEAPLILCSDACRYAIAPGNPGTPERGELQSRRIEHRDALGRIIRWEERGPDDSLEVVWIGVFLGEGPSPQRGAYWIEDGAVPYPELFVPSPDNAFCDVLYGSPGEKLYRQMRTYFDDAGRDLYQEYFAPGSQRKYSEEIYRYDDQGNELGRTWQRLDGKASRTTEFEIIDRDAHGRWLRRLVRIDGELQAIDERTIEYASAMAPVPNASAGPVPSSDVILPVPFAPGVISTRSAGENSLTFSPDGREVVFFTYEDDWTDQVPTRSEWSDGAWREAEPIDFGIRAYNGALSEDGQRLVFCQRDDALDAPRVFVAERCGDGGWGEPVDLTERGGFTGSYFRLLSGGTLYFHRNGDLFRAELRGDRVIGETALGPPINTEESVEFGAWVDSRERVLLFTRSVGGDAEASGLFVSIRREAGSWGRPVRLPIPYGWSACVSPDSEDLVYTVGEDIFRVPLPLLAEWIPLDLLAPE